ncbi:MAG: DUF192 domain-containing protein [Acidobacteria bacterium]|nr:DUF192 domain-containing protein [Acidobacteriota bacterium]
MRSCLLLIGLSLFLSGCGSRNSDSIELKQITLPGGKVIRAEVMLRRNDMMRGMMFRPPLALDRGLLFVHTRAGKYSYWMSNVKVPLDIIWMDKERHIVEMSPNTPPCLETDPVKCPTYGGKVESTFALELSAGQIAANGLAIGQQIDF